MNFDQLVVCILNEHNINKLLALDGRREIYAVVICRSGEYMVVNPLRRRLEDQFLKEWDDNPEYHTYDYNTTIDKAVDWYSDEAMDTNTHPDDIRLHIDGIRAEFEPFKDMKGVWKFMMPNMQFHRPRITIGIEVDASAYRGVAHAQEDLYGF
jgi:hypothetical protein